MKNIYKKDEDRITISEAKRLIKAASPEENFVDICVGLDANGIEIPDCIEAVQQSAGRYDVSLESDFLGICKQLKIQPRSFWRPALTDYTASQYQDETYAITHDEFIHLVNFFGSKVIIGVEPKRIVIPEGQSAADASIYAHAWYDSVLNAASWWVADDVTAGEAALLLCEFDPLKFAAADADKITTSQTDPDDFLVLRRAFEGIGRMNKEQRSLNQWRLLAIERGLKYHSWVDDYAAAQQPVAATLERKQADARLVAADQQKQPISSLIHGAESDWGLNTPQRYPAYRLQLYRVLKAAHAAGEPCPNAREVLDIWAKSSPIDLQLMSDGVKYSDAKGTTKTADLKAIQQAISGLLK